MKKIDLFASGSGMYELEGNVVYHNCGYNSRESVGIVKDLDKLHKALSILEQLEQLGDMQLIFKAQDKIIEGLITPNDLMSELDNLINS